MKVDITTVIVATIVGLVVAYLVTNSILKDPVSVVVKTINDSVSTELPDPNPEVFNYRALNPTIEVYVDCTSYDASGSCKNVTTGDN